MVGIQRVRVERKFGFFYIYGGFYAIVDGIPLPESYTVFTDQAPGIVADVQNSKEKRAQSNLTPGDSSSNSGVMPPPSVHSEDALDVAGDRKAGLEITESPHI